MKILKIINFVVFSLITKIALVKNGAAENYFNPKSKEADSLFVDILNRVCQKHPRIKSRYSLEINSEVKYTNIPNNKNKEIRAYVAGEVLYKRKESIVILYNSVFNLLGLKRKEYIFIVAHELFHLVHYVYHKEHCLNTESKHREFFADRKAIEILNEYYPNTSLSSYENGYEKSRKMFFWNKVINKLAL